MVVVLENRLVVCGQCKGSGLWFYTFISPADGTIIRAGLEECTGCWGEGYEGIEVVEVAV